MEVVEDAFLVGEGHRTDGEWRETRRSEKLTRARQTSIKLIRHFDPLRIFIICKEPLRALEVTSQASLLLHLPRTFNGLMLQPRHLSVPLILRRHAVNLALKAQTSDSVHLYTILERNGRSNLRAFLSTLTPNEERLQRYLEKYSPGQKTKTGVSEREKLTHDDSFPEENTFLDEQQEFPPPRRHLPKTTGRVPTPEEIRNYLSDEGALDIKVIDVSAKASFTDSMIILSARSGRHAVALADELVAELRDRDVKVDGEIVGVEGKSNEGPEWLVVDIGKVVVHFFEEDSRQGYDLEGLWESDGTTRSENLDR